MRIAIIVTDLSPPRIGGISKVATSIASACAEMGHEVDVFCLDRSAELHRDQAYNVVPVRPRWVLYDEYPVVSFSMAAFSLLLKRHRQRAYDVSHAMNFNNFGLTFFRFKMNRWGLAHLSTGFETTQMELKAKWKEFLSKPSLHNFAQIVMESWLAPWQRSYIGWGDHMSTEDVETRHHFGKMGLDESKISLIPSGVNLGALKAVMAAPADRSVLDWGEGERVLLCPGRVDPRKGSQYLLKAFAAWRKTNKNSGSWRLVFVGGGRGSYLDMMKGLSADLGMSEHVQFTGKVDDLYPYYHACDAVAIPSLSEGIPITLQEALVFKKPIWCSKLEGTHHWAQHLGSVRWCEAGDVEDWVRALDGLLKPTDEVALEQGANWMEDFDWRGVAKQYLEAYGEAIKARKRQG